MFKIYQTSWADKMVTKGMEVILEVKMVTPGAISDFLLIHFFSSTAPE